MKDALDNMTRQIQLDRHNLLVQQVDSNASAKRLMLLLALGGLALGLGIAHLTAYSIVRAIRRMLSMIETVSSNNLVVGDMEVGAAMRWARPRLG
jgi:hypothetical protein